MRRLDAPVRWSTSRRWRAAVTDPTCFGVRAGSEHRLTVIASVPTHVAFAGLVRLRDTVLAITAVLVVILLAGIGLISDPTGAGATPRCRSSGETASWPGCSNRRTRVSSRSTAPARSSGGTRKPRDLWLDSAEALGRKAMETVIPAPSRQYDDDLASYSAGGRSDLVGQRVEMTALHRDGHEIPVEVGVWAHEDGGGFSAFVHDITERITIRADWRRPAIRRCRLRASRASSWPT